MIRSQIDEDLVALTRDACARLALPRIAAVVLPEKMLSESEANAKHDKFGLVVLEDGSAGFFYRLLQVEACTGIAGQCGEIIVESTACHGVSTLADGYVTIRYF